MQETAIRFDKLSGYSSKVNGDLLIIQSDDDIPLYKITNVTCKE